MKFTEALKQSAAGRTVISNIGSIYTPEMLNAKMLSDTAAICNACVTVAERKGDWRND